MIKYTLSQLSCLLLLVHTYSSIPKAPSQDIVESDSTLIVPGKDCQSMKLTFKIQLTYSFLQNNCANIDRKNMLRLETTFDDIETKLFEDLPKFKKLEAKYLNFRQLSISSFNLRSIDFSNNKLEHFRISVHGELEELYLSHNKLSNIELLPVDQQNVSLKILDMSYNFLSTIDGISNFSHLKSLNVSNNEIKYLDENIFVKLKYLSVLNLSFNKLTDFPTCVFCSLLNLKYLDLSDNNLKHTYSFLEPLRDLNYLNLNGNNVINLEYRSMLQTHPNLELLLNCHFNENIIIEDMKYFCSSSFNDSNTCCSLKRRHFKKRSVSNSHFHVAINNKKLFHNVSSISRHQNMTEIVNGSSQIPLKDFFEKLHNLNVDNVRSFLNVTFAKVDTTVAQLDYKYGKIQEKLDLILPQLDSKLNAINETLNDMVLEISNLDSENSDIFNVTFREIAPNTAFLLSDYEHLELLLTLCVFLLLILVCLTIFRTVIMIKRNRRFKINRLNLLNLETVP